MYVCTYLKMYKSANDSKFGLKVFIISYTCVSDLVSSSGNFDW